MSTLVGKRFVNVHNGQRATLVEDKGGLCLQWKDRAELRTEPITVNKLKANWQEQEGPSPVLRDEEIRLVARAADQALRAIERHEPWMFWQLGSYALPSYDPKLVEIITTYLRER